MSRTPSAVTTTFFNFSYQHLPWDHWPSHGSHPAGALPWTRLLLQGAALRVVSCTRASGVRIAGASCGVFLTRTAGLFPVPVEEHIVPAPALFHASAPVVEYLSPSGMGIDGFTPRAVFLLLALGRYGTDGQLCCLFEAALVVSAEA